MDYLEFIARVTSHIPDKGQVMLRDYGLYANAHRGKNNKIRLLLAQQREELRDKVSRKRNLFSLSGVKFLKGLNLPDRDKKLLAALTIPKCPTRWATNCLALTYL